MTTGGSAPPQSSAPSNIDLNALAANPALLEVIKFARPETPEERVSRIRRENITTYTQLAWDFILKITGLIALLYACYALFGLVNNPNASVDAQKLAIGVLSAILSGIASYVFAKSTSK